MLLSKEVEVTVTYKNINRYIDYGYKFPTFTNSKGNVSVKKNTKILVNVEHLDIKSGSLVAYRCDYCGEDTEVRYCDYMKHYQDGIKTAKDCCIKCIGMKTKDTMNEKYGVSSPYELKEVRDKRDNTVREKYGVDNVFQLNEVRNKIIETNLNKYGEEYYTQTDEYKERSKQTCMEKYGVDNASKSPEIINKIKEVQFEKYGNFYSATIEGKEKYKKYCMDNYGVINLFQLEEIKYKSRRSMKKKYGVEYLVQIPEIAHNRTLKGMDTKFKMGLLPSSRQQEYLHKYYGGVKNYVVSNCALDIALLDDSIYIEYDGSGHDLRVKYKECTQEEFERKEMSRKYFLLRQGWKEIRIISLKDYIPSDEELDNILNISKAWFDQNHTWIKFDIDNSTIETSDGVREYSYKGLRKIKDKDLEPITI